ncbi:MAG: hypothetical protein CMI54_03900 [Parcubacteria group bacterium]|nr:hypothetical protein [Parcubacteria group bacterium]
MSKKLGLKLKTFTLPAGYTCPGAKDCLAYADRKTGKVKDGKETQFRCFMASLEATFPSLRAMVWENYEQLQVTLKNGVDACADLIHNSLPKKFDVMRVHVGGDYFSKEYLQAWIEVAKRNPDKVFYSYSKSLHLFREFALPENLVLTASRGGKYDDLIDLHAWKEAVVVFSEKEAADKDLEIDHDDSHAAFGAKDFALLIHGTQPAGSIASEALKLIKKKARA